MHTNYLEEQTISHRESLEKGYLKMVSFTFANPLLTKMMRVARKILVALKRQLQRKVTEIFNKLHIVPRALSDNPIQQRQPLSNLLHRHRTLPHTNRKSSASSLFHFSSIWFACCRLAWGEVILLIYHAAYTSFVYNMFHLCEPTPTKWRYFICNTNTIIKHTTTTTNMDSTITTTTETW